MTEPPWEDPRTVLRRHGLRPKRQWSQNFLIQRNVVERIADACNLGPEDEVIELGPGVGTLTRALLRRCAHVTAVERDPAMLQLLDQEFASSVAAGALDLRAGDAASFDLASVAQDRNATLNIAGNLPYAVTGAILRNLGSHQSVVGRAVLMVQREVRDRLVAPPSTKAYGALTVFVRTSFDVTGLFTVSPQSFFPAPAVSSAVVALEPRSDRIDETAMFRRVVRAAFDARRKTLRNALRAVAAPEVVASALAEAAVDPTRRGETLSVTEFATVAARIEDRAG